MGGIAVSTDSNDPYNNLNANALNLLAGLIAK